MMIDEDLKTTILSYKFVYHFCMGVALVSHGSFLFHLPQVTVVHIFITLGIILFDNLCVSYIYKMSKDCGIDIDR